jgi:hypothetical protein
MTGLEAYHHMLNGGIVHTPGYPSLPCGHYWRFLVDSVQMCVADDKWVWMTTVWSTHSVNSWTADMKVYTPPPQPTLWDLVRDDIL